MDPQVSVTSVSLLARLRDAERDEDAWAQFVERYGQRIYAWCLSRRLQPNDAEDVTQNVLIKLARYMNKFEYDATSSFRGWLRRVTENAIKDYFRERSGKAAGEGGTAILDQLNDAEAPQDLLGRLNDVFDLELMEEAMSRVSGRVATNRWMAWQLTAKEGRSGADVAKTLNMKVASVYTARNQIQTLIREEIARLEDQTAGDNDQAGD